MKSNLQDQVKNLLIKRESKKIQNDKCSNIVTFLLIFQIFLGLLVWKETSRTAADISLNREHVVNNSCTLEQINSTKTQEVNNKFEETPSSSNEP